VARAHPTWLSGKETGHVPFRIEGVSGRLLLARLVRFVGLHFLTSATSSVITGVGRDAEHVARAHRVPDPGGGIVLTR
jgi:putative flavoprotein involved in K+ transport